MDDSGRWISRMNDPRRHPFPWQKGVLLLPSSTTQWIHLDRKSPHVITRGDFTTDTPPNRIPLRPIRDSWRIRTACVSADGRWLASQLYQSLGESLRTRLLITDLTRNIPVSDTNWNGVIGAMAFAPDAQWLAVATSSGGQSILERVEFHTFSRRELQASTDGQITTLAFSPSGRSLAFGGTDHLLHVVSTENQPNPRAWRGNGSPIEALSWNPTGDEIIAGSSNGEIRAYRITPDGPTPRTLSGFSFEGDGSVTLSPEGQHLAGTSTNGSVQVRTLPHLQQISEIPSAGNPIWFRPGTDELLTLNASNILQRWNWQTGQPITNTRPVQLQCITAPITSLAVSTNGILITCLNNGKSLAFQLPEPTNLWHAWDPSLRAGYAAISPDGRWTATAHRQGRVRLFEKDSMVADWPAHALPGSVSVSPDGLWVAMGQVNGDVTVYQRGKTQPAASWHTPGRVESMTFDPAGQRLLVGTSFGVVHFIDTARWNEAVVLPVQAGIASGGDNQIMDLLFSRDGGKLVARTSRGILRIWRTGADASGSR